MSFQKVCKVSKLKIGAMKAFEIVGSAGKAIEVLLHRQSEHVFLAVSNWCPHKQASLAKGDIEDIPDFGLCVKCPKHRKKFSGGLCFRLSDGASYVAAPCELYRDTYAIPTFSVRLQNEHVWVSPNPAAPPLKVANSSSDPSVPLEGLPTSPLTSDPESFIESSVHLLRRVNHNTVAISVTVPTDYISSGLCAALHAEPPAWHVSVRLPEFPHIVRDYTPTSTWKQCLSDRTIDLLIKKYQEGEFTSVLERHAKEGTTLLVSPPQVTVHTLLQRKLLLLGGGTGIVPLYQIVRRVLSDDNFQDHAVSVIVSQRTREDLLLWDELLDLQQKHSGRLRIFACLSDTTRNSSSDELLQNGVSFHSGRISSQLISWSMEFLDVSQDDGAQAVKCVICGPSGFLDHAESLVSAVGISDPLILDA
eukprot:ANDGO_02709.mRNA.1 NADH-cytochrome b5 reductase 2